MKLEDAKDQKLGSRWDQALKVNGKPPQLPPIIEGRFLIESIKDLGFCAIAGMGAEVPLSFSEIEAYARASGELGAKEMLLLKRMSRAFCSGKARGRDFAAIPPWPRYDDKGDVIPEDDPDLEPWEQDNG